MKLGELKNKKILIVGRGVEGKAAYKYLKRHLLLSLTHHRPTHLGASEQVQVHVKNGLASVVAAVEYGSKSRTSYP